ncbi:MAG: exonuclease SbcCD subunit D, partial [Oscillospiraceae bacterium]
EKPQAVIIAGDVYDKTVPPAEAVRMFDDFLVKLSERGLQTFVISGNHDSAERLSFGGRLMGESGVHLSPVYSGESSSVTLHDEFGAVHFWLLPFVKPAGVRRFFEDEQIETYTDAIRAAVSRMNLNTAERNVLVTHQFVTGAQRSDSEEITVGGTDNVDACVFADFDYTALGHIHAPQNVGSPTVRYCGTPLKYSFSEKNHVKSVTVAEIREKGCVEIQTVPLKPLHDVREIRGSYAELTLKANYEGTAADDYIKAVLTDEEEIPDAMAKLRLIYPNILALEYDNTRTRCYSQITGALSVEMRSEIELFDEFYEKQNGKPMTEEQKSFCEELIAQIKEEMRCDP